MIPPIGVLQGRLTPSNGRGIQFFPEKPGEWEAEFFTAQKIGLTSIELLVRPVGLRQHPLMTVEGRARLQSLVNETGVRVPSVHGYTPSGETYEQDLVDIVRATKEIGAKVVLVSFFKEGRLSPIPDETWDKAHRLVAAGAREAALLGVQLGIEAELPAQALLDFISQAETSEAFGVYYDVGNQFACGFPVAEELLLLKDSVVGVHLKDRLPQQAGEPDSLSVPLGQGTADFATTFKVLKDIGYTKDLIIQGARREDGSEEELYQQYREYVEKVGAEIWN